MLLKNATVYNEEFNPVRADIDVQGDKIACVGACVDSGDSLDLSGYTIIPGLIDMHIHGCAGEDTSDTDVKVATVSLKDHDHIETGALTKKPRQ